MANAWGVDVSVAGNQIMVGEGIVVGAGGVSVISEASSAEQAASKPHKVRIVKYRQAGIMAN